MKLHGNDHQASLVNKDAEIHQTLKDKSHKRDYWGRQIDFTLSCVGYAVGLGNLWRFPYLCMRNGGGAFLIPYFLFLFICGLPLFYLELVIGQFSSLSAINVWKLSPLFEGLGWGMIAVSAILTVYYNTVIAWTLYFLGMSFTSELPWSNCNNTWNTASCYDSTLNNKSVLSLNGTFSNISNSISVNDSLVPNVTETPAKFRTPAEEFFQFNVLDISSGINDLNGIRWQLLLCLLAAWVIVFLCLFKGVKSSGKVVYVTATVPYLFLTILLVRGATLPGAYDGIIFYIKPDFNRLLQFKTWAEACQQIFYSLGPAWGGLITMASYNKFDNNCARDAVFVCLTCCGTSFYAGFVIFSIIGFMAQELGQPVSEVITSGPGLAFIAYPEAITKLPISPLWAICFFLMLLTLGLDSQFAMVETVTSGFVDQFPKLLRKHKTLFTAFVCCLEFIIGLPLVSRAGMYIFQILDWYTASFSVLLIGIMESIILSWVYGLDRLYYDISMMQGSPPYFIWKVLWGVVTPFLLMVILVYNCVMLSPPSYGDYTYPAWAQGFGIVVAMVSVIPIPVFILFAVMHETGSIMERLRRLVRTDHSWGPAKEPHRSQYKYAQYNSISLMESSAQNDFKQ